MDLVVAVSCSGETEETLSALDEAIRRGARVVTVGAAGSSLSARADDGRAVHLPVDARGRMPRANLWGLAVPVLLVLDVARPGRRAGPAAGRTWPTCSTRRASACGPGAESSLNPAKQVAVQVAGSLPYVWGASDVAVGRGRALRRPAGGEREVPRGQRRAAPRSTTTRSSCSPGASARSAEAAEDIFRDPFENPEPGGDRPRMRLVLLRDTEEVEQVARRADATVALAERFDVAVDVLRADGDEPLLRLASLVAPLDFASVYLALLQGIDPSPIEPIVALKSGILEHGRASR